MTSMNEEGKILKRDAGALLVNILIAFGEERLRKTLPNKFHDLRQPGVSIMHSLKIQYQPINCF